MEPSVAIVGAGVSGLTCAVLLAESGCRTVILAAETGAQTTSAAAAAIWYPYDAEPFDAVIAWSLTTYDQLRELARDANTGVTMIELRQFARKGAPPIPDWALKLGARELQRAETPAAFSAGFALTVPLTDTSIYLDYLASRFTRAGGEIHAGIHLNSLDQIDARFRTIINCSGVGARSLVSDYEVEPHRGQVVLVSPLRLAHAIVCDDAPLMYAIPRASDCVFGGTNKVSDDRNTDPSDTETIIEECSHVLALESPPRVIATRVGLRPFRRSGVRLETERLRDDRIVIHNYGHGGSGFTLSWGCARDVLDLLTHALQSERCAD